MHRLTPERWYDAVVVFGARGDPPRCWCQWFRMRSQDWGGARTADNRTALKAQADGEPPPGLLAQAGDESAEDSAPESPASMQPNHELIVDSVKEGGSPPESREHK